MKRRVCFEIPFHVSGLWKPYFTRSAISTGSVGAGLLLEPGALCCAPSNIEVPVLPHRRFFTSNVECRIPVPIGAGFATSAVYSMAHSLFEYSSFLEAVARAHIVEVTMRTGLGDVMAIAFGKGLVMRTKPGGPGWGHVSHTTKSLDSYSVIALLIKGAWRDTPSMLSSLKRYDCFDAVWDEFVSEPSLETFLIASNKFSKCLGMYPKWLSKIEKVNGVLGSYAKKSVGIVVVENEKVRDVRKYLEKLGMKHFEFKISSSGARLNVRRTLNIPPSLSSEGVRVNGQKD